MTEEELALVEETLEAHLASVEREMGERLAAATPSGERPGFGKRAGDYVAQVVDDRTNHQLADRLGETAELIRGALHRLETGGYGACVVCGAPIGAERLEALPWARTCIGCREPVVGADPRVNLRSPVRPVR